MGIEEFQNKKVWAVVGKVHDHSKYAYKIYKFLQSKGYRVYAVDPTGEMVDGEESYQSLTVLPEKPDAVNLVINPYTGEDFINQAKLLDIDYIWFQPGADTEELVVMAEAYGMKVVYNHCVMVDFK